VNGVPVAFAILAGLLLSACSPISSQVGGIPSPELSPETTPTPTGLVNMDLPVYTGNDSSIEAQVGDSFLIRLDSNPTTGYSWELADDYSQAVIELVESTYQAPETQRKGAGGQDLWQFKAVGTGNTRINLRYRRVWEEGVPPIKTQSFEVEVGKN